MGSNDSMQLAFRRAVELSGSQQAIAQLIKKTQSAVSKRLSSGQPLWAEDVLTVERATGISRHDLRPDLYPRDDAPLPPRGDDDHLEGLRA